MNNNKNEISTNSLEEKFFEIDDTTIKVEEDDSNMTYEQNDAYKSFYGTWKFTEVVSQHTRLGGDDGYEELIGKTVTYSPDRFKCNEKEVANPTYLMTIGPIKEGYNQFFPEQIGLKELLVDSEFFVFVQIVNKTATGKGGYNGTEFIMKNDSTMYCFDYNCIYKLTRESYVENYDYNLNQTYSERY